MSTRAIAWESGKQHGKALPVALWVAQILLALAFGMDGWMKVSTPLAALLKNMPDMAGMPGGLIRFIGISELAGELGLLLPALTRSAAWLTLFAGVGLATVMVLASVVAL